MNLLLLACLALTISLGAGNLPVNDEKRLIKHLLTEQGYTGRPVAKADQAWNVSFSLNLLQITDVDVRAQSVETLTYITMMWNDKSLKWNPSDFGNVDSVRLPQSAISTPDITLFNAVSRPENLNPHNLVVVMSDGGIIFVQPIKQRFTCGIPDSQVPTKFTCSLKFGSWSYDGNKLNLTTNDKQADVSLFKPNPGWDVARTTVERHVVKYPGVPAPYIDLTYNITIKLHGSRSGKFRNKSNKLDWY